MHHPLLAPQHSYGTRIRKNSVLKQSARLRQSPPRRIRPVPAPHAPPPAPPAPDPCFPVFPLPGVMLHPEDASSKVFHAIGRSFLSVENRAMTIKDLAEMTLKYGLLCQNVSAASQAITTYIRNHMARCDAQEDHPLLLRHVLSGTLADDDLVPALHSRVGGATSSVKSGSKDPDTNAAQTARATPEGERLTNFRRGTMVWYLSKAAGVSCPFARAGIRLCEYGKEGRRIAGEHDDETPSLSKKPANRDEARCGEKRKRLRRGCRRGSDVSQNAITRGRDSHSPGFDSGYGELSADSSDDERPPKVKLTLRLRPTLSCAPRTATNSRSKEVVDLSNDLTSSSSEDDHPPSRNVDDVEMLPDQPEVPWSLPPYPRRSISVPRYTPACDERTNSPAGLNQCYVTTDERKRSPSISWSASPPPDSDHDDFDLDSDADWDSSSFSLHSPVPALQVKVETVDDLQPFRQEPTDIRGMLDAWEDLDCPPTHTALSEVFKPMVDDDLEFDAMELWDWEFESGWTGTPEDVQDAPVVKVDSYLVSSGLPDSLSSPFVLPHPTYSPTCALGLGPFSPRSPGEPSISHSPTSFPIEIDKGRCALAWQDAELLGPDSVHPHEFEDGWVTGMRMHSAAHEALDKVLSTEQHKEETCTAARKAGICDDDASAAVSDIVVVRTCRPCSPDVCATQVEGISVYQTKLGQTFLLRRIDTDFVNLSTIMSHLSLPVPSPLPGGCVSVSHSSACVEGIWAPLNVARLYARGLPKELESVFLSEDLVMRFPTALQHFYQQSASGRLLNQFGPQFNASTCLPVSHAREDVWQVSAEVEEPLLVIPPSVNDALAALHASTTAEGATAVAETPLSPTEQEMFHVLCIHPDWEAEDAGRRPLRRSRRVADAAAARARVVPARTRHS